MRFAITGSTGLIGSALCDYLSAEGHAVTRVVRSPTVPRRGEQVVVWSPRDGSIDAEGLEGHDVVIHLAGESIAGLWTEAKKRRIRESRVEGTTLLSETLARLKRPPTALFSASAFGFYGDRDPGVVVTEASPAGKGFLAKVAVTWEAATHAAEGAGIRVVHMRFANVLDPQGGILHVFIPLFKLGLGAKFGSGDQVWPWIARAEIPPALLHVLEHDELRGPVNFAAPRSVTNQEFSDALGAVVGRPVLFRVPEFAARLAPGGMGEEMLLSGARVVPEKLQQSGYSFRYPELRSALRSMLRGGDGQP